MYSKVSEWEVILWGIPYSDTGMNVVVNWNSLDINNRGIFYTDSNGLAME